MFLPLIERIESKLEGWKGRLISRGGRLQLMNSVLSSILIYFMSLFLLPMWVIKRIDKIRKSFLWGKSDQKCGISLINWKIVCLPKEQGGMGAANLAIRNKALLLRWWWRLYPFSESLWIQTVKPLYNLAAPTNSHQIWKRQGSFFWVQLLKIRPIFDGCVSWNIANGAAISNWFDSWTYPTKRSQTTPELSTRKYSLKTAMEAGLCEPDMSHEQLEDRILWRWTKDKEYSANSYYKLAVIAGATQWEYWFIWKIKVPPTVRVFAYLLIQERILTHDVMLRRGLQCDTRCEVCQQCSLETSLHLFVTCSFAQQVWSRMSILLGTGIIRRGDTVQATMERSWTACKNRYSRNEWSIYFFAVCWFLWRGRSQKIFDSRSFNLELLAQHVKKEAGLWRKYC